jgi:predicted nucleic-acid-binding Zn-ribbon protein
LNSTGAIIDEAPHGYRTIYCDKCGHSHKVAIHCTDRTCIPCVRSRSYRIYHRISRVLAIVKPTPKDHWRHITLTIPTSTDLSHKIDFLFKSFREFRKHPAWKRTQKFGFFVLEIKYTAGYWNPHLHIITYGSFIHWKRILKIWHQITKVSEHIWVTAISDRENIARYVAKYVAKVNTFSPQLKTIINQETKHRRLFSPFGNIVSVERQIPKEKYRLVCPKCGNTSWVLDIVLSQLSKKASHNTS